MTIKEMFKKVETYNEVAELMRETKAKIYFASGNYHYSGESFTDYNSFRKWIKKEYIKEVAEIILKDDSWEFDGERELTWTDFFGAEHTMNYVAELVAQ